ncbi:MAG TPA: GWxTD domain-containing protein [Bryobacteraceae bacterium]
MLHKIFFTGLLVCSLLSGAPKRPPLAERFKTWLNQDVVYIITDEEKKEFQALDTDEAREKYIENFWEIRNPMRSATQNPFKEEHYRRIEYANQHFGRQSNTPGWMTDQGRAWILFGKPTSQHAFTGYGQIYPLDLWFYENNSGLPSLPPFYYILFYIPDDIGEYKFYRPYVDGPLKLVRGARFNTNRDVYKFLQPLGGDVAHSSLSLLPNDPIDTQDFQPDMSSDMLVNRIKNFANDPFNVRRIRELRSLRAKVSSVFLVTQNKPLELATMVLADPTGKYWLDYEVLVDDLKLGKLDAPREHLNLSVAYRLATEAGDLILEDTEDAAYAAFEQVSNEKKFQPFTVAGRLPVEPGNYKLTVAISNRDEGKTYSGEQKLSVGAAQQLSIGGLLLVNSVEKALRPDALTPFQYFGAQFHPSIQHIFNPRDPLRLLFELNESPGASQGYQLEYVIASLHNRESRRSVADDVSHAEFKNGTLLKSKSLPLAGLEAGDYRMVVNLRTAGSTEVAASANLPIKIEEAPTDLPFYILGQARNLARPGVVVYMRALEAMAQKNEPAATDFFKQALDQNPANAFASQYLIQLYFSQRQFARIAELYKRLGIDAFKSSPVTLAQVSLSFLQTGNPTQARDVLVAAMNFFPDNPVLMAAASNLKR